MPIGLGTQKKNALIERQNSLIARIAMAAGFRLTREAVIDRSFENKLVDHVRDLAARQRNDVPAA